MAHIDAGKTALSERILYYTGINYKIGDTHEGTATMDWMEQEQEEESQLLQLLPHVIGLGSWSIRNARCFRASYQYYDTPGRVDFTVGGRSLRVLDSAIGVFCAKGGVEPQSGCMASS